MKAFFKSIKNGLLEVFSDDDGRLSSMRIGFFWILVFETFNQTYSTFHGVYTPLNLESMGVLVGAFFAKSWQRKIESDSPRRREFRGDRDEEELPEYPDRDKER